MTVPFRNTIRLVDDAYFSGSESKEYLSIELLPDGFVFSVLDAGRFRYTALEGYSWHTSPDEGQWDECMMHFVQQHPLLRRPFSRVNVTHYSPRLVLVPLEVYREEEKEHIFGLCAKIPSGHQLRADRLNNLGAYGLYTMPNHRLSFCDQFPGQRNIFHHGSALIESVLASRELEKWDAEIVLHVRQAHFDLLLFNGAALSFYQTFRYHAIEDLLYYLFYALEQHGLRPGEMSLVLLGEMGLDSAGYVSLSRYFKKLTLPGRNDMYHYSPVFAGIANHFYYNLLNLNACG